MNRKASSTNLEGTRSNHAATFPLLTGMDFTLVTPPMKMCWEIVVDDLRLGCTSCVLVASPRYGKTQASHHVERRVAEEFPTCYVLWFDAQYYRETLPSEKRFFGDLLISAGHSLATAHDAERRKSRFIDFLWSETVGRGGSRVVLIIDEIQDMKTPHWRWLRDVWNALQRRNVKLQIVGFGQMQVLTEKNSLLVAGEQGLISRFLSHLVMFQGLTCVADFEAVGHSFDTELQHPLESGLSFTQFLLPAAYGQGFRMRDQGAAAFAAFRQALPEEPVNVGMEWVILAYRAFLKDAVDCAVAQGASDKAWRTAVETARFVEAQSYVKH